MEEKEKQKQDALLFLKENTLAVISTVSIENTPESATIYYVVDDNFNFYFMSETNSRKVNNFRANPHVALVIGTENAPVTAQVEGEVKEIDNGEDFMLRYEQLQEISHKGQYTPLLEGLKDRPGGMLFKLTPTWLRWTDFRQSSSEMRAPVVIIP